MITTTSSTTTLNSIHRYIVQDIWNRYKVPGPVQEQHDPMWWGVEPFSPSFENSGVVFRCACGFKHTWSMSDVSRFHSANRKEMNEFFAPVRAHYMSVVETFKPTIAEMSDWGWYAPEVW